MVQVCQVQAFSIIICLLLDCFGLQLQADLFDILNMIDLYQRSANQVCNLENFFNFFNLNLHSELVRESYQKKPQPANNSTWIDFSEFTSSMKQLCHSV